MTLDQKVEKAPDATTFAENLPERAAELYVTDAAADDDLAKADRLPRSSIDAEFYGLMADRRVARTGCGRHGYGATISWPYGAKCFGSSPTASTPRASAYTGPSSPPGGSSGKASTSPASTEWRPSASPTPAAPGARSCRTSAARSA